MPTDTGQLPTYLDAVSAALDAEMDRDPDVFIIGEDVGQFGGAFKVTKGFLDKYRPRRVVDTPIAETGFTGLAAGAALVGLRPVVEFQFADFISCAFDPIINVLARHHYRNGDPMPVTLRAPFGARLRAGPTHSQSVESYFAHVPGLKIVMPGTPEDTAGLLISSIRDNNPVLILENKYLYRRLRVSGPLSLEPVPLGQAGVVRPGTQVSLITYSAGVSQGLEIAAELDKEGISVEVVDIRTLVPLDVETIVASVKKTSRAVVLHEAALRMGFGAEIAPCRRSASGTSTSRCVGSGPRTRRRPPARRWRTPSSRNRPRSPPCCGRWPPHDRRRQYRHDAQARRDGHRGHRERLAEAGRRPGRLRRPAVRGVHRQGRLRDPQPLRRGAAGRARRQRADRAGRDPAGADRPAPGNGAPARPTAGPGGPLLSPVVRRLAAENSLDLSTVRGTGPAGRIRREDVAAAIAAGTGAGRRPSATPAPAPAPAMPARPTAPAPASADPRDQVEPLSRMRLAVAEGMVASLNTSAHVWTSIEVDFDAVDKVRATHKAGFRPRPERR